MNFWQDVPTVNRVNLFDLSHIIFLITVFIIVIIFIWKLDYVKEKIDTFIKVFITISIVQVVALYSWSILEIFMNDPQLALEAGLPIHLCRMSTFLGLWFLFTKNTKIFNALFYMSFFALIAIFYPVNVHPIYTHIIGWSYQISHIMIILVWIMGVYVYGYRPNFKTMNKVFVGFVIIVLVVWQFNYLVGDGEYLYLRGDVNRPFLKDMHDLIWIFVILLLSYGVMGAMTLPFTRRDKLNGDFSE